MALEGRMSLMEDDLNPLKQEVKTISDTLNVYALEDLENRMCRNNVRILGLPKWCEGSISMLWLVETFGKEVFLLCNWKGTQSAIQSTTARGLAQIIFGETTFFFFKDKETILQKARERRDIFYNGVKILFFPDFSPKLQNKRGKFVEIKKKIAAS